MHILHVETGRYLYGGALQVLYLINGLGARGGQNTLICTKGSEIGRTAADSCTAVYELPMAGELDLCFVFRLRRIIGTVQPDIVHIHSRRGADLWGALAAQFSKTRVILTRRVDNPEQPWLARTKYRLYDRIITISEGIRHVLLSEGVPEKKLVCVPSAVDNKRYENPCEKEWFCKEFGLDASNKVIAIVAQFIARKGHRFLVEAAPTILAHYPDTRFIFLGQGPLQERIQQLCKSKRIADKVHFAGFRTDLERILPCIDIIVHPATMEGLGVSLLQAAASGIPIVATRVGGIPEIVQDDVNGYLVATADLEGIIHAVLALLGDAITAKRFGLAGREIARSRFSANAMVEGNLRVYRETLAETV